MTRLADQKETEKRLTAFFGQSTTKVNVLLLHAGYASPEPPEWLRGKSRIASLPRYSPIHFDNFIYKKSWGWPDLSERLIWIVETLHKRWSFTEQGFHFEDLGEATHFKLRWY